jgi:hypothetical protein
MPVFNYSMGQQEVYDFLMKNPDQWYTSKQISEQLIVSIGSVTMSLKKLRKTNIIKFRNTGKRNTFQYMVQSEPTKITIERKTPLLEIASVGSMELNKVKVKIKPKIVHQHSYLGGQTFYGVIRPKEEVDAIQRQRDESPAEDKIAKMVQVRATKRVAAKKTMRRKLSTASRAKPKSKAKVIVRKTASTKTKKRAKR